MEASLYRLKYRARNDRDPIWKQHAFARQCVRVGVRVVRPTSSRREDRVDGCRPPLWPAGVEATSSLIFFLHRKGLKVSHTPPVLEAKPLRRIPRSETGVGRPPPPPARTLRTDGSRCRISKFKAGREAGPPPLSIRFGKPAEEPMKSALDKTDLVPLQGVDHRRQGQRFERFGRISPLRR